jgi:anthranilate phosphoribosyltransferase
MILDALHRIANHCQSLTRAEAREVMAEVLAGNWTDAQIAALLVALRMKGETVEEIVGFAEAIRAAATPMTTSSAADGAYESGALYVSGTGRDALVDTSGTGGDASGTFNISTATAFVTAGAGVRVAKHGNRSISSKCGSADVMEALGVNIRLTPESAAQCLREIGICFLYAPDLHSSMKQVQKVRRELRLRTMFNRSRIQRMLRDKSWACMRSIWSKSWPRRSACWDSIALSWCTDSIASTRSPSRGRRAWPKLAKEPCGLMKLIRKSSA